MSEAVTLALIALGGTAIGGVVTVSVAVIQRGAKESDDSPPIEVGIPVEPSPADAERKAAERALRKANEELIRLGHRPVWPDEDNPYLKGADQ